MVQKMHKEMVLQSYFWIFSVFSASQLSSRLLIFEGIARTTPQSFSAECSCTVSVCNLSLFLSSHTLVLNSDTACSDSFRCHFLIVTKKKELKYCEVTVIERDDVSCICFLFLFMLIFFLNLLHLSYSFRPYNFHHIEKVGNVA